MGIYRKGSVYLSLFSKCSVCRFDGWLLHEKDSGLEAKAKAGLAVVLFAMFYPVLTGIPVEVEYVKTYLKWFKSWVLIGNLFPIM